MAARNIPSLTDDFIALLRTCGLTKEELQEAFRRRDVRVARTDFDRLWGSLTERVGYEDAADLVFDVVAEHASERLRDVLAEVRADGDIGWRADDRAIITVLFFANGKPRKICSLLVDYLEDVDGWFEVAATSPTPGAPMNDVEAELNRRRRDEDEVLKYVFLNGRDVKNGCVFGPVLTGPAREEAFERLARQGYIKLLDRQHAVVTEHGQQRLTMQATGAAPATSGVHSTVHNTFNIQGGVQNLAQSHGDGARISQASGSAAEVRGLLAQAREIVLRELSQEHQVEAKDIIEVIDEQAEKPNMKAVALRSLAKNPIFSGTVSSLLAKAVELIVKSIAT